MIASHVIPIPRRPRVPCFARLRIRDVLIDSAEIPGAALGRYASENAGVVRVDPDPLRSLGRSPELRDLPGEGDTVRHDPRTLGQAVLELASEESRCEIAS